MPSNWEAMNGNRLFVYGSLKRGCRNHAHMRGAIYRGEAITAPGYLLYLVGHYPALVVAGEGTVKGELYEVTDEHLERLDVFEGHPDSYRRVSIVLADGLSVMAYTMGSERARPEALVCGGSWSEVDGTSRRASQR